MDLRDGGAHEKPRGARSAVVSRSCAGRTGAWLSGRPITVSQINDRARAILCSGLPTASVHGTTKLNAFLTRAESYKKLRALGSAALMLAYVACGRCDAYAEDGIAIWDVAAGLAIVSAAGGRYTMTPAGAQDRYDVEATNAALGHA